MSLPLTEKLWTIDRWGLLFKGVAFGRSVHTQDFINYSPWVISNFKKKYTKGKEEREWIWQS